MTQQIEMPDRPAQIQDVNSGGSINDELQDHAIAKRLGKMAPTSAEEMVEQLQSTPEGSDQTLFQILSGSDGSLTRHELKQYFRDYEQNALEGVPGFDPDTRKLVGDLAKYWKGYSNALGVEDRGRGLFGQILEHMDRRTITESELENFEPGETQEGPNRPEGKTTEEIVEGNLEKHEDLSPEEKELLRELETAVLDADFEALQAFMSENGDDPEMLEKLVDSMREDLPEGVHASATRDHEGKPSLFLGRAGKNVLFISSDASNTTVGGKASKAPDGDGLIYQPIVRFMDPDLALDSIVNPVNPFPPSIFNKIGKRIGGPKSDDGVQAPVAPGSDSASQLPALRIV